MKTQHLAVIFALLVGSAGPLSASEMDRKIENAATSSYNYRTVLADQVRVSSRDGMVTLTGTVQDTDQKQLAEDTVENLPGVNGVNNQITIKSNYPEHSDAWIAFKIRSQLLVKANVSATATTVRVQDGVVALSGTADNLAQKELTEVYAREVDGVKSVTNAIVVNGQPAPAAGETVTEKIDDASITTQVKYALLTHKATSALKTKVSTENGAIVIRGEAGSDAEKSLVTKLAQDVRGVRSVTNQMTIRN